jgi:alanine racemase
MTLFKRLIQQPKYVNLNQILLSSEAIQRNFSFFKDLTPHHLVAPVLKSNAYGHGLVPIAKIVDELKPPFIIVDSLFEAYELQLANIESPILIMGFTHPENFKLKKLPFHTVVYDLEMIETLYTHQPQMPLHLKIDTGMNRQGVRYDELEEFLQQLKQFPHLKLEGAASHLSDADNPISQESTIIQARRFAQATQLIESYGYQLKWKHLAASAGSLRNIPSDIYNLIRLGIGLYGIPPVTKKDPVFFRRKLNQLRPALRLETTIAQIKKVAPGETVGYNNTFKSRKITTLGVLPIGYYDGVDRRLSNRGCVLVNNMTCPIVGRVSMNITTVDLSQVHNPQVGQKVIVYSDQPNDPNSIQKAALLCETIPYELLVHLAESIKRITV